MQNISEEYYLLVIYHVLFSIGGHHLLGWVGMKLSVVNPGSDRTYLGHSD